MATLALASLAPGVHSITSVYSGDGTYAMQNSAAVPLTIGSSPGIATTTTVSGDLYGVPLGSTATIVATVTSAGVGPIPTGSVTFFQTVMAGTPPVATLLPIGSAQLNGTGMATFTTASLPAGMNTISASYTGDVIYAPTPIPNPNATPPVAYPSFVEVIGKQAGVGAGTTLSTTAAVIAAGGSVTITATETPQAAGLVPTGLITFTVTDTTTSTTTSLGSFPIQPNINTVSLTTTNLPTGVDNITAHYGGDLTYNPNNSGVLVERVGLPNGTGADTVTLSTTAVRVAVNGVVTFTAAVAAATPAAPLPTGTVTFYDGSTALGTAVQLALGQAVFTTLANSTNNLPEGLDTVTAVYSGDPTYQAATSNAIVEVVGNIPTNATSTILTTSSSNPAAGGSVTLTAVVSNEISSTVPTGTVSFIQGSATLGTATVLSDGSATFVRRICRRAPTSSLPPTMAI